MTVAWPVERAGDALVAVAAHAGLVETDRHAGEAPSEGPALLRWLEDAGPHLGLEIDPVEVPFSELATSLAHASPALITTPSGVLAVIGARRHRLVVLDPTLQRRELAISDVVSELAREATATATTTATATLANAQLSTASRDRAVAALVAAALKRSSVGGIVLVRRPPEATAGMHARDLRLAPRLVGLVALHVVSQLLWLGSWWAIGHAVLGGAVSAGWLAAWALLLASGTAGKALVGWWSGHIALDAGMLLSQRLFAGVLRLDPDVLRREGIGASFGRVLESAAIQQLAVGGGLGALLAAIEVVLAALVLVAAGGIANVLALVLVLAAGALAVRSYVRERRAWTATRLALTHGLVEGMLGHATRLAQGDATALADREDRGLATYHAKSEDLDRAAWRLSVLVPLSWPIAGTVALAPALLLGTTSTGSLAAILGGVLVAAEALSRLTAGAARLVDTAIAWDSIRELFDAAATPPDTAPPALAQAVSSPSAPALTLRGVSFRHAGRGAPVLAGCDLAVGHGERVLVDAPSGSGKSTLAALVAGLRRPDSGLVLAGGLDRASLGAQGWRRRVAYAPQFHDDHVFTGTLLFNLLVGRAWPPSDADIAAAEAVCHELGLDGVLHRMPAGLLEQVGETGWQLSHGERSRLFLARTLLQQASVTVLDESFAALDPENQKLALACLAARAKTAIVIAHP